MSLRDELIQVAAVAVAMIEDLDFGVTGDAMARDNALGEVFDERDEQEAKWGPQHHSMMEWLSILGEEYGEACQAANETHDWRAMKRAWPT